MNSITPLDMCTGIIPVGPVLKDIQWDLFIRDTLGPANTYVHCKEVVHSSEVKNVSALQESLLSVP